MRAPSSMGNWLVRESGVQLGDFFRFIIVTILIWMFQWGMSLSAKRLQTQPPLIY